jgi:hypothetical protein
MKKNILAEANFAARVAAGLVSVLSGPHANTDYVGVTPRGEVVAGHRRTISPVVGLCRVAEILRGTVSPTDFCARAVERAQDLSWL